MDLNCPLKEVPQIDKILLQYLSEVNVGDVQQIEGRQVKVADYDRVYNYDSENHISHFQNRCYNKVYSRYLISSGQGHGFPVALNEGRCPPTLRK